MFLCAQRSGHEHIVGVGGKIDKASCCKAKHVSFFKDAGVWSGGGNGKSSGSGAEYDEQAGGQGRRIEEGDDRNGGKVADSSEDVGGMLGIAGKGIEHIDKSHTPQLYIMKAVMLERR